MSQSVTIDGTSYSFPTSSDTDWSAIFEAWAAAVTTAAEAGRVNAAGVVAVTMVSTTATITASAGSVFKITVNADVDDLVISDGVDGQHIVIIFASDVGVHAFGAIPIDVLLAGGAFALSGSSAIDVLRLAWDSSAGVWVEESRALALSTIV